MTLTRVAAKLTATRSKPRMRLRPVTVRAVRLHDVDIDRDVLPYSINGLRVDGLMLPRTPQVTLTFKVDSDKRLKALNRWLAVYATSPDRTVPFLDLTLTKTRAPKKRKR